MEPSERLRHTLHTLHTTTSSQIRPYPPPFNKDEFDRVIALIERGSVRPFDSYRNGARRFPRGEIRRIEDWLCSRRMYLPRLLSLGKAKVYAAALYELQDCIGCGPETQAKYVFLTVPDNVRDVRRAWKHIFCTVVAWIAQYVVAVPPDAMRDAGVRADQFLGRYFNINITDDYVGPDNDDGDLGPNRDSVMALAGLLSALSQCEITRRSGTWTAQGQEVKYIFVIVMDRIIQYAKGPVGQRYMRAFKSALDTTARDKMRARIIVVDDVDGFNHFGTAM